MSQPLVKLSEYARLGVAALHPSGKPGVFVPQTTHQQMRDLEAKVRGTPVGAKAQATPRHTATLPAPPSANRYWRNVKGRMVKSREARDYRRNLPLPRFIDMIHGPVAVEIRWARSKRMGDLDNRIKVILDALSGRFWPDDKQIVELHAYRSDDGDDTVTVTWWAA